MGASRHVALLRGINVGGRHLLPMQQLVSIFEAAGATEVRTYIQSGNVVYAASPAVARGVPAAVAAAISGRLGFDVPVVTRTAVEMREVVRDNPFLRDGAGEAGLHVAFLKERPAATASRRLDPDRSPPDTFVLKGRNLYLDLPNGVARTRLTNAYLDATLQTISTLRNWRTVLKLVDMSGVGGA